MRELVLQVSELSLDGYIAVDDTEFGRLCDDMADDVRDEWMAESLRHAGIHAMGRVTYESMARHWPSADSVFAEPMNRIPKVVFSRTLDRADWTESSIVRGDTRTEMDTLKGQDGSIIVAHGGAKFMQSLTRLGIVDEYRLIVYPIAVGTGSPLFADLEQPQRLDLVDSATFPSGVVALVYRRATS